MGVINCKNCQCNKKEEEASDELNIEGQKKERRGTNGQRKGQRYKCEGHERKRSYLLSESEQNLN